MLIIFQKKFNAYTYIQQYTKPENWHKYFTTPSLFFFELGSIFYCLGDLLFHPHDSLVCQKVKNFLTIVDQMPHRTMWKFTRLYCIFGVFSLLFFRKKSRENFPLCSIFTSIKKLVHIAYTYVHCTYILHFILKPILSFLIRSHYFPYF